ncbi:MAG TPA: RNA polymerase sigma factor [Herpetosiphonaceae bacterium]|nr:RNA polymerase sigma factor [Herpetosiphonaceae bacterium]
MSETADFVASISLMQGWELSERQCAAYALFLDGVSVRDPERRTKIISVYHADHPTVRVLSDQSHPDHAGAWQALAEMVMVILQRYLRPRIADPAFDAHDLAQMALERIGQSLAGFKYESRLATWIQKIVTNVTLGHFRDQNAQRRRGAADALEKHTDLRDPQDHIEAALSLREICEEIARTLAASGDDRLVAVFQLKVLDDQRLQDIGARLQLSPARISALLQLAKTRLRDNTHLRREAVLLGIHLDEADRGSAPNR